MAAEKIGKATQSFVPIEEIRDGIVVLKDGSLRGILMASSLNFALKSGDEQNAIIAQFQNFLNSLEFPIQFFIQSRQLDIRPYIAVLEGRYKEQVDDLMRIQIREYIEFVKKFVESTNIMAKSFFVVVPYDPSLIQTNQPLLSRFFGKKQKEISAEKDRAFEEHRTQLEQRMAVVEQGLVRSGVRIVQLGTEEAIELYYKLFNPGELEKPIQLVTQR